MATIEDLAARVVELEEENEALGEENEELNSRLDNIIDLAAGDEDEDDADDDDDDGDD
jgi:regulator of replication initiation timing